MKPFILSASLAALLLGACGDDTDSTNNADTGRGAAGSPALPSPTPTSTTSTLVVENHYSSVSITGLYLSPSARDSWGPNQLDGSPIAPGRTFTLRNIPCLRNYDLKVTASGGRQLPIVTGIYFGCGIEKVVSVGD